MVEPEELEFVYDLHIENEIKRCNDFFLRNVSSPMSQSLVLWNRLSILGFLGPKRLPQPTSRSFVPSTAGTRRSKSTMSTRILSRKCACSWRIISSITSKLKPSCSEKNLEES